MALSNLYPPLLLIRIIYSLSELLFGLRSIQMFLSQTQNPCCSHIDSRLLPISNCNFAYLWFKINPVNYPDLAPWPVFHYQKHIFSGYSPEIGVLFKIFPFILVMLSTAQACCQRSAHVAYRLYENIYVFIKLMPR